MSNDALGTTEDFPSAPGFAVADLRGVVGVRTNNPPVVGCDQSEESGGFRK